VTYAAKALTAPLPALAAIVDACTEAEVTRVLIVEDDGDTRYAMTRLFAREGFLVDCAASVDDAVPLAIKHQ
jgi:ActR/RegA family two-component response regulator